MEDHVLDFPGLEDGEKSVWLLDMTSEDWRLGKVIQKMWR